MALVDYSSSASSADPVDEEPPPKRRRKARDSDSGAQQVASGSGTASKDGDGDGDSDLPPLPSSFHDLYASTVRQSVSDDPSLHQGRKRLTPHVPGNWPSHVYVEWYPTSGQHAKLTELLKEVETMVDGEVKLHGFLTSDLGAPLPLHISLSRPMALPTADKDAYFDTLSTAIKTSGVRPFTVTPRGLAWYRSPESERTFLILRVTAHNASGNDMAAPNPQLLDLLTRCNSTAKRYGQLPLYQRTSNEPVGTAFHVSIAWCFGMPGEETTLKALKVLKQRRYADMQAWDIDVPGIKVKIGNVVHHVPLGSGSDRKGTADGELFER